MTRWIFLSLLSLSLQAFAIVDMKNANYSETWTDIEVPGGGYTMKVARTYNSRALFNGMFGFGWCSDFETTLEVSPEGNLWVTECGAGSRTTYAPTLLTEAEIGKSADQIIAKVKAEKVAGRTEAFYADLRKELILSDKARNEYAKKYRVSTPPREGLKYLANGKEVEHFVYAKPYYVRNFADGSSQRFDKDGKITHFYDKNQNFLKYEYEKGLLASVTDNNSRRFTFKYFPNKKVREIIGPNGLKAEYKFEKLDDLSFVKNGWGNSFTYQYDEGHNLTKATWPDKSFISIKYDQKKDWVVGFTDRDKCIEAYSYEDSPTDPKKHYWSIAKKTCKGKVVAENRYEFWHKKDPSGQYFLEKVLSEVSGEATEITYHEVFGKPTSIRKNQNRTNYEYYPDGLVKVKATTAAKMVYTYEPQSKRISKVAVDFLNEKSVKVASKWTAFKYDAKSNLNYAENSDGQKINLTYDNKGRIATIVDQAKKVVKIDYEDRFGKPSLVTRPGLGTIKVSYTPKGEIQKVDSKEGPTVAIQVASAFNNLLDVIAPATAEIYL
ncbi:MAG: cell wall-associated protein wapA [Bdellovibrionaceae bacterium]|nr:cell wall-associated protein wapA [Pseudobdellovibrionaceae bacterium]